MEFGWPPILESQCLRDLPESDHLSDWYRVIAHSHYLLLSGVSGSTSGQGISPRPVIHLQDHLEKNFHSDSGHSEVVCLLG